MKKEVPQNFNWEDLFRRELDPRSSGGDEWLIETASLSLIELSRRLNVSPERIKEALPKTLNFSGHEFRLQKDVGTIPVKKLIRESVIEPPIKGVRNGGRRLDEPKLQRKVALELKGRSKIQLVPMDNLELADAKGDDTFSGEDKSGLSTDLFAAASILEEFGVSIGRAQWRRLNSLAPSGKTVVLGIDFCPLYETGTSISGSRLMPIPSSEVDVLQSRVGGKWLAAKQTIDLLTEALAPHGLNLKVNATFADVGIFSSDKNEANPDVIDAHGNLINDLLNKFLGERGIPFLFRQLSGLPIIDPNSRVKSFAIASESRFIPVIGVETVSKLVPLTKRLKPERKNLLNSLLRGCDGRADTFQTLVNTYLNYDVTSGCDIHLSIERSDGILALQSAADSLRPRQIPALNILVK